MTSSHLVAYLCPLRQRLVPPTGHFRHLHERLQRQRQDLPTSNMQLNADASFALYGDLKTGKFTAGLTGSDTIDIASLTQYFTTINKSNIMEFDAT